MPFFRWSLSYDFKLMLKGSCFCQPLILSYRCLNVGVFFLLLPAISDGSTLIFFLLSALCSASVIISGSPTTKVANFPLQPPQLAPDSDDLALPCPARGNSWGFRPYFAVYPELSPNTDIISFLNVTYGYVPQRWGYTGRVDSPYVPLWEGNITLYTP